MDLSKKKQILDILVEN